MAERTPPFRPAFPLLLTSTLLLAQPMTALANGQVQCRAGTDGSWVCSSLETSAKLPPRPQPPAPVAHSSKSPAAQQSAGVSGVPASSAAPAHTELDWVPRDQLTPEQQAGVAAYCSGTYVEPERSGRDDQTPFAELPISAVADSSSFDQDSRIGTLEGDVVLRQGRLQAQSDHASFDQNTAQAVLTGNVRLRDQGVLLLGERAQMQVDTGETRIDDVRYVVHEAHARGEARKLMRRDDAVIVMADGSYTTCEPGQNTWTLRGKDIELDREKGWGEAKHVTLRVKDIPVFYTPYLYFPIDDRRQSGLLVPSLSYSRNSGSSLTTPYYFNLAPNYDATLYPTLMSDRGLQLEGEFRYLTPTSEGQIGASVLDDREDERKLQSKYKDQRWMYSWQHVTDFNPRLRGSVDYTGISDPYYFQDLDTGLGIDKPAFLDQRGTLTWRGDSYTARLNAHAYEMATIADVTPYNRLPQLTLNGKMPFATGAFDLGYAAEFVRFDRNLRDGLFTDEDGNTSPWLDSRITGLNRANGDRVHFEPGISLPLNWSWGYLKPTLKLLATQYDLSLDQQGKAQMLAANEKFNSSPSRELALYSIDSGLYFDRDTSLFGSNFRQTLEPRAMYLYVPHEKQDDIPIFDSGESSFSYGSLWRENRFSGKDRIGDENRLSLGATSRWIEANGFERQRFSLGQAFHFADRKVQLRGIDYRLRDDARTSTSPYAMEYLYRFNRDWRVNLDLTQERSLGQTRAGSLMFHYQPQDNLNKVVNFGYRYRNDAVVYNSTTGTWQQGGDYTDPVTGEVIKDYYKIQQHDASVIWPMVPQWNAIARWQYDYNRSRTLEAFGGFEYDSCCWKLRLINRYWVDYNEYSLSTARNEDADRGIFLQIVLKGLGGVVGNKVESFLDQGIQGYREREDQAF